MTIWLLIIKFFNHKMSFYIHKNKYITILRKIKFKLQRIKYYRFRCTEIIKI